MKALVTGATGFVGAVFDGDLRKSLLVRFGNGGAKARELEARFETEIFRKVERVCAAADRRRRIQIGRVIAEHSREFVAEFLGEQTVLPAAIMAAADQLLFQLFIDALRLRRPLRKRGNGAYGSISARAAAFPA